MLTKQRTFFVFVLLCLLFYVVPALALETGAGSYQFLDVPSGKSITIWYYKPVSFSDKKPVVIAMHGMNRNAESSRDAWLRHADKLGVMVLAPHFDQNLFPGSRAYNQGNIFRGSKKNPPALWSFRLVDAIFDDFIVKREKTKETKYYLFGHSAGGQFVHRMLLLEPETKAGKIIAANPGWYTMPEFKTAWPLGLKGTDVTNEDIRRFLSFPLIILLGEKDNDPNHDQLEHSPEIDLQGDNRLARGKNYYANGKALAKQLKIPFAWKLQTVPGVAHSNSGMVTAAASIIDEDIKKAAPK